MFEKEAKERARDYTENKERQIAYECGFLDGADRMKEEMQKQGLALQSDIDKTIEQNMALKLQIDKLKDKNEALEKYADVAEEKVDELKEKLAGAERNRDNLRQLGFPTFQSCKEYADEIKQAKEIIKLLLWDLKNRSYQPVKDIEQAEQFLKEEKLMEYDESRVFTAVNADEEKVE